MFFSPTKFRKPDFLSAYSSLHFGIFFLILNWLAHFVFIFDFGLYYDDYFSLGFAERNRIYPFWTWDAIRSGWGVGRPIQFFFRSLLFSQMNNFENGLLALHFMNFVIQFVLLVTIFLFFKKIFSERVGFLATILYALSPSFPLFNYLTNMIHVQVSLLMTVTALWVFGKTNWYSKAAAYVIFVFALLCYEIPAMIFFLAPFFFTKPEENLFFNGNVAIAYSQQPSLDQGKVSRIKVNKVLKHFLFATLCLVLVVLERKYISADWRSTNQSNEFGKGVEAILSLQVFKLMFSAILTNFTVFFKAAYASLMAHDAHSMMGTIGSFPLFLFGLNSVLAKTEAESLSEYSRICLLGLIVTIVSLSLVGFTSAPMTMEVGRETRIFGGAIFGVGLTISSWVLFCLYCVRKFTVVRRLGLVLCSVYLSLLVGYNILIQKDYAWSWAIQKKMWSSIVELCPDLKENTIILVSKSGAEKSKFVDSFYRAATTLTSRIFSFPNEWDKEVYPQVFVVDHQHLEGITRVKQGRLELYNHMGFLSNWHELPDLNTILLTFDNGAWERKEGRILLHSKLIELKKLNNYANFDLGQGSVYKYFVADKEN